MRQIIKIIILFLILPVYAQKTDFSQNIMRSVGYIQVDNGVKNVFIYIDTAYSENRIRVHNMQMTQNFAKMKNDTIIISKPNNQTSQKQPLVSVYLNHIPKGIDIFADGECIFTVLNKINTNEFSINAKENAKISFCVVDEWIFNSLSVNQESNSDIYFSKLSVNKNLFLKTADATFQANEENIKDGIKSTILSHNSSIKIKGFTTE
ncbi:MAG: hypothetical protein IJ759_07710 [Bacteroidales bacterium]|nr:hypothetical protein [Bacteroidales bacterium]